MDDAVPVSVETKEAADDQFVEEVEEVEEVVVGEGEVVVPFLRAVVFVRVVELLLPRCGALELRPSHIHTGGEG